MDDQAYLDVLGALKRGDSLGRSLFAVRGIDVTAHFTPGECEVRVSLHVSGLLDRAATLALAAATPVIIDEADALAARLWTALYHARIAAQTAEAAP